MIGSGTYKEHFRSPEAVERYEASIYAPHSYSSLLWEIEKKYLMSLLEDFRKTHDRIDYLDFAAGTGRVLSFLEDKVDTATGIEISPDMAARASARVSRATVFCTDITAAGAPVEGTYDLITAFRFLLNAETGLQLAGLRALRARLRDDSSILLLNNHGNPFSHKMIMLPVHMTRRRGKGHLPEGNYLTNWRARALARDAGLRIERIFGYGFLSDKITRFLPFAVAVRLEKALAAPSPLSPLCVNQLYVARRC